MAARTGICAVNGAQAARGFHERRAFFSVRHRCHDRSGGVVVAQEAINNTARHSQAEHFSLHLVEAENEIRMMLIDDGKGWDHARLVQHPERGIRLGLAGMQERASLLGGKVNFSSMAGSGLVIRVTIPYRWEAQ